MKLDRAGGFLTRVTRLILSALGLAVLAATFGLASWLPGKDQAVAVAIVGTFIGTALVSLYLPKLVVSSQSRDRARDESRSEMKGRWRQAEQDRQVSQQKLLEAAREIARLESMRINVAAFQPILKLGLLEVETSLTDFQRRIVGNEKEEVWWRNGYRQAYLGVVQIPVKAHLGIDLQKVRVREASGRRLVVSGMTMSSVIDTAEGAKWLLDEIRTEFFKGKELVKFKGDPDDARAKAFSREQELQIRARLKQGCDFQVFESGLIRAAEQLLRVLLAPLGKEIEFESGQDADSRELFEYLSEHNRALNSRLAALSSEPVPARQLPQGSD